MAKGEIVAIRDVALRPGDPTTPSHKEITYTVDGKGPYVLYLPADGYRPEAATAAVQARVREWAAIVGKPIES